MQAYSLARLSPQPGDAEAVGVAHSRRLGAVLGDAVIDDEGEFCAAAFEPGVEEGPRGPLQVLGLGESLPHLLDGQPRKVRQLFRKLRVPNTPRGIVGVYDVSDDWVPIYDRTALAGYYVAIGTSGNQFKNAPVVGRFLADIIRACEDGHDHDNHRVQVALARTGLTADMGHYSRRREINHESSFSVMG